MTFTAVNKTQLQQAFAIAHRASEDPNIPNVHRSRYREIATLIWKAHGERGKAPDGCGKELMERTAPDEYQRASVDSTSLPPSLSLSNMLSNPSGSTATGSCVAAAYRFLSHASGNGLAGGP